MVAGTNDFWQDCWHLTSGDSGRGKRSSDQLLLAAEQARLDDYVSKFWELPHTNRCDYSDLVVHLGDSPATGWGAVLCSMSRPTPHTSRNVFVNGIPYLCSVCRLRCIPCLSCFHATNKLVGCTQSTWQLNACCPGGVFCWIPSFEFPVERIRAPIKRALPNYGQEPVAIAMNDTLPLEMHVC